MKPRLLDLFCCAGGAAHGYWLAGFDVTGVDIKPQPHYPYPFVWADAMMFLAPDNHDHLRSTFDAIHASPPCQAYSVTKHLHDNEYPELVGEVRARLDEIGLPYVIENVVGAPMRNAVRLCGSSFGLPVWRHRLFEVKPLIGMVPPCAHHLVPEPLDVTGTGGPRIGDRLNGGGGNSRKPRNLAEARDALGIGWMTRRELSEAIPPAYTEFVGRQLLAHIQMGVQS